MLRAALPVLSALALLAACRDADRRQAAAPPPAAIAFQVDDGPIGPLAWKPGDAPVVLRHVVPQGAPERETWHTLIVKNERSALNVALDSYRDYDVWLYQRDDGKAMAGLFRRPKDGKPPIADKPIRAVVAPTVAQVRSREAVANVPEHDLELIVGEAEDKLTLDQLQSLPNTPWNPNGRRRRAWSVRDVLSLSKTSLQGRLVHSVSFFDKDGASDEVPGSDLDALVMRSAKGGFHIKKQSADKETVWRFRDAIRIRVTLQER